MKQVKDHKHIESIFPFLHNQRDSEKKTRHRRRQHAMNSPTKTKRSPHIKTTKILTKQKNPSDTTDQKKYNKKIQEPDKEIYFLTQMQKQSTPSIQTHKNNRESTYLL